MGNILYVDMEDLERLLRVNLRNII